MFGSGYRRKGKRCWETSSTACGEPSGKLPTSCPSLICRLLPRTFHLAHNNAPTTNYRGDGSFRGQSILQSGQPCFHSTHFRNTFLGISFRCRPLSTWVTTISNLMIHEPNLDVAQLVPWQNYIPIEANIPWATIYFLANSL